MTVRLPFRRLRVPLLCRAQQDPDAFADFYDAYADRVLAFFARRVFDPELAFDLMSETFAVALERRHQFRGSTTEEEQGWLFAIARSELSHWHRRGSIERAAMARMHVPRPHLDDADLAKVERMAGLADLTPLLQDALAALPADQRRAVELRVGQELDYAELAAATEVSEQVARARVSRGLRALASALRNEEALEGVF